MDDIVIHFNHYKTIEDANEAWERRKKRIDFDNLYIIMYDLDGITKEDIIKLDTVQCKNKIVFSENSYPDISYVYTIETKRKERYFSSEFMQKDRYGIRGFEKKFDFVQWLNCE